MNKVEIEKQRITTELKKMRENGFVARRMAHILDVSESTVHGWLRGDFTPNGAQLQVLRAFATTGKDDAV